MSVQGIGAIQRRFVSAFDYVLACVGQRGSRSRQTGDMVYRMGMAMEGCRPWITNGSIWGPTWLFLGLMSTEGHLKLALAVPGSPWAGPYDPMGALYGRRGHGRLRRPRIHIPGTGKG